MQLVRVGTRCNNACITCEEVFGLGPCSIAEVMSQSSGIALTETVWLGGGEPTLHDQLPAMVEQLRAAGFRVGLRTNARRLAYRAYATQLARAGVQELQVKLLGSTAPMHDYHVAVDGAFQQTMTGVRNARQEGLRVQIDCVVTRSNYRHLAAIASVCAAAGVQALRLCEPRESSRAEANWLRISAPAELVRPYAMRAMQTAERLGLPLEVHLGPACAAKPPLTVEDALARPRPAPGEKRVRVRKTGTELQAILPSLFGERDR